MHHELFPESRNLWKSSVIVQQDKPTALVPIQVLLILLPIHFPCNTLRQAAEDAPRTWVPVTRIGVPVGNPGSLALT